MCLFVGVTNLTCFFGFWFGFGGSGLSDLEVCLVRSLVVGVLIRKRVAFERGNGLGCASHGRVLMASEFGSHLGYDGV